MLGVQLDRWILDDYGQGDGRRHHGGGGDMITVYVRGEEVQVDNSVLVSDDGWGFETRRRRTKRGDLPRGWW